MKRFLQFFAVALIAMSTLTACGSGDGDGDDAPNVPFIGVWNYVNPNDSYELKGMFDFYEGGAYEARFFSLEDGQYTEKGSFTYDENTQTLSTHCPKSGKDSTYKLEYIDSENIKIDGKPMIRGQR